MNKINYKTYDEFQKGGGENIWQEKWEKQKFNQAEDFLQKEKKYILVEFPYPSGAGLHVGHVRSYTALDIMARMQRLQGYNVLYPMGWDAFGLPTENYAIKHKIHPRIATEQNIATFKKQMKNLGLSFDWPREIDTTDPQYYRWTQWIFLQLYKKGLAYKKKMAINWCPSCKIGLANEEVVDGKCERCGAIAEQREKEQWMLAITKYADRLISDLDTVDYLDKIKVQQVNWIGKSEGAELEFAVVIASGAKQSREKLNSAPLTGSPRPCGARDDIKIKVFTTRPDTLFGATYMVLAPEHELVEKLKNNVDNWKEVTEYVSAANKKNDLQRASLEKEKTGVELKGIKAINPANNEEIPVWIADYVLTSYGTGAIMAVPAHDHRDWEFAKKFNLTIKPVIISEDQIYIDPKSQQKKILKQDDPNYNKVIYLISHSIITQGAKVNDGSLINSGEFDGMNSEEAKKAITEKVGGKITTQYKLRDWVFSRQHYWGEPIPMVYCEKCSQYVPKILLIHGIYGHSKENWFPWFKKELEEKGYEVLIPDLPNTEHPTLKEWLEALNNLGIKRDDKLFIVGHSLGAPVACQFILKNKFQVEKLILVAPTGVSQNENNFTNLRKAGCDEAAIKCIKDFNNANTGLDKLKKSVRDCVIYFSDNDPYIPLDVRVDYKILQAEEKIFKNKWHFNNEGGITELPEILSEFPSISDAGWLPVPEKDLPVKLPDVEHYEPTDTGESPLAAMSDWVNVKCPQCGSPAKRETDTMPNWAGSSWYFLRYCDPKNNKAFADEKKLKYWLPVDLYNGGMEHTTLHLLYSRFWNKFLYDCGIVPVSEPYARRVSHGMVLAEDGKKMSKSLGNVINPDEVVNNVGADSLRLYEMFMGPFADTIPWSTEGVKGVRRFLEKVWNLKSELRNLAYRQAGQNSEITVTNLLHKTIKKVTEDIGAMKFNTAVSTMMIFVNEAQKTGIDQADFEKFLIILAPFAPHIAEELFTGLGHKKSIFEEKWPTYDKNLIKDETIQLAIQINGKLRDTMEVAADITDAEIKEKALASEKIKKWTEGKEIVKIIVVKNKLISLVIK